MNFIRFLCFKDIKNDVWVVILQLWSNINHVSPLSFMEESSDKTWNITENWSKINPTTLYGTRWRFCILNILTQEKGEKKNNWWFNLVEGWWWQTSVNPLTVHIDPFIPQIVQRAIKPSYLQSSPVVGLFCIFSKNVCLSLKNVPLNATNPLFFGKSFNPKPRTRQLNSNWFMTTIL